MKIIVDADACPVKKIIKSICKKYNLNLLYIHSINHISKDEDAYINRIVVDSSFQAADMAIVNNTEKGDIVITSDIGLAALVLGKGGTVMNPQGDFYTNSNIDQLLENRLHVKKIIAAGGKIKGPSKRKKEDDQRFSIAFENHIQKILLL